jgi:hypothetical protein
MFQLEATNPRMFSAWRLGWVLVEDPEVEVEVSRWNVRVSLSQQKSVIDWV